VVAASNVAALPPPRNMRLLIVFFIAVFPFNPGPAGRMPGVQGSLR
jgi:hypothetical protein